ncbi:MAG TPA: hypothetical protein VGP86_11105 [Xanthobacteraceae bacterium]|jgi:hypothetical protein|nr:hypothetical protein [Xanthobacteraceae bacterium]
MLYRSFIGSIVAASVLCLAAGAGAQTPDLSKSPDWSGQWKRTSVVAFACLHSRFASAQDSRPAPRSATPPSVQTPAAKNPEPFERAILYVEDQNEGQRNAGMVRWRTRKAAGTQGAASKLVLEANIEITDGHLKALLSIMPSDDGSQSTIQMIEAIFTPLPGFIHGSISSLAGILVKEDEVKRGVSLARTGTATGANTFRVPLAQGDFEKAQNLRMLRDNPWISLAIVFSDGRRAVIAVEKGASGDKAVATALATWK